jgi:hypothetical protein
MKLVCVNRLYATRIVHCDADARVGRGGAGLGQGTVKLGQGRRKATLSGGPMRALLREIKHLLGKRHSERGPLAITFPSCSKSPRVGYCLTKRSMQLNFLSTEITEIRYFEDLNWGS